MFTGVLKAKIKSEMNSFEQKRVKHDVEDGEQLQQLVRQGEKALADQWKALPTMHTEEDTSTIPSASRQLGDVQVAPPLPDHMANSISREVVTSNVVAGCLWWL